MIPTHDQFEAARAGDAAAQRELGLGYLAEGRVGRAHRWLRSAAEAGDAPAAATLGQLYLNGAQGLGRDAEAADHWLAVAAEAGDADARYWLTASRLFEPAAGELDAGALWNELLTAARAGQPRALRAAGLVYVRRDLDWACRCFHRAAVAGDPVAAHLLAIGLRETPQRAESAAAWLARAATAGLAGAQRELEEWGVAAPREPDAAGVDAAAESLPDLGGIEALVNPAPELASARQLAERPRVWIVPELLNGIERAYLVDLAEPALQRSHTVDPATGQPVRNTIRTSSGMDFGQVERDVGIALIQRRIMAATGLPAGHAEPLAVLRYAPGEEYLPHFDFFKPGSADARREVPLAGQRAWSVLVYLNRVAGGGGTELSELDETILPEPGKAVVLRNLDERGEPDRLTRHAGLPVTAGEKWLATQWARERPYRSG